MKHVKMFGKSVPLIAIVLIGSLTIGGVGAALLSYYGRIQMGATILQSVIVDNGVADPITSTFTNYPGTVCETHTLENLASIEAPVKFVTIYNPSLEGTEIITKYTATITEIGEYVPGQTKYVDPYHRLVDLKISGWKLSQLLDKELQYTVKVLGDHKFAPNINIYISSGGNNIVIHGWGKDCLITGENIVTFAKIMDMTQGYGATSRLTLLPPNIKQYNSIAELKTDYGTWNVDKVEVRAQGGLSSGQKLMPLQFVAAGVTINVPAGPFTELTLQPGEGLNFHICYTFHVALTGPYTITTEVKPVL